VATGGLTSIRDNFAYMGWIKQAAWGTDLQATSFWKLADSGKGSKFTPKNTLTDTFEGDTNIFENLTVKEASMLDISISERVQPVTVGCGIQAIFGSGSDTVTAASYSSTLALSASAGATTVKLTADPGNIGTLVVLIDAGTASAEVVALDLTTRTTPNYTVTIAASGTLKLAHNNAATIASNTLHTLTPQNGAYDPYTIELGIGSSAYGGVSRVFRGVDCVGVKWGLQSGPGGKALLATHDWYGGRTKKLSTWATPSYEGGNVAGSVAASPMTHNQATWTMNSLTTGEALTIKDFQVNAARNTAADDFLTELIYATYFQPGGQFTISGQFDMPLTSWREFDFAMYGVSSAADSAVDSYIVGYMPLSVVWQPDAFHSLTVTLPNIKFAVPNPTIFAGAGKALSLPVQFKTNKNSSSSPITIVLANSQTTAY